MQSPELAKRPTEVVKKVLKPFVCTYSTCKRTFRDKNALLEHLRMHRMAKEYVCYFPSCQKRFTHYSSLQKHERIHRGERPFKCDLCGQAFTQISNLRRHERVHRGEKPHECRSCSKKFSTSSNLKQHMLVHQTEDDREKFTCQICHKGYFYKASLNKHMKQHRKQDCGSSIKSDQDSITTPEFTSVKDNATEPKLRKVIHKSSSANEIRPASSNAAPTNITLQQLLSIFQIQTSPEEPKPEETTPTRQNIPPPTFSSQINKIRQIKEWGSFENLLMSHQQLTQEPNSETCIKPEDQMIPEIVPPSNLESNANKVVKRDDTNKNGLCSDKKASLGFSLSKKSESDPPCHLYEEGQPGKTECPEISTNASETSHNGEKQGIKQPPSPYVGNILIPKVTRNSAFRPSSSNSLGILSLRKSIMQKEEALKMEESNNFMKSDERGCGVEGRSPAMNEDKIMGDIAPGIFAQSHVVPELVMPQFHKE